MIGKPGALDQGKRVHQMVVLIGQGLLRAKRLRYAAEEWWISARQCENLIALANEQIRKTWEIERPGLMASQQERSKPGPRRRSESKRNIDNWVVLTAFLKPETHERLQNVIHIGRSTGVADLADQSEALEAALQPYLQKMEISLKAKLAKQLGLRAKSNIVRWVGIRKRRDLFSEHGFDDSMKVCSSPGVDHLLPLGLPHRISGHCDATSALRF